MKWKHFPRYWPFVRGMHQSPVNSPHKGQWRRALVLPLIFAWINGWVNCREAGDSIHHRVHHDVTVLINAKIARTSFTNNEQLSRICTTHCGVGIYTYIYTFMPTLIYIYGATMRIFIHLLQAQNKLLNNQQIWPSNMIRKPNYAPALSSHTIANL